MKPKKQLITMICLICVVLSGCSWLAPQSPSNAPPSSQPTTAPSTPPSTTAVPDTPTPPIPPTKYGIVFNGKVVADKHIVREASECFNGNMQLVVFYTESLRDDLSQNVALYDCHNKQVRFIADLAAQGGHYFWTGWLNDASFFVADNYHLATYGVDGTKRASVNMVENGKMILGLAWSRARQTMAVMEGYDRTSQIDLVLLDEQMQPIKRIPAVDKCVRVRGPSGAFAYQKSVMAWDYEGEQLAFTKTPKLVLAIYQLENGTIHDHEEISGVEMIEYDLEFDVFLTLRP